MPSSAKRRQFNRVPDPDIPQAAEETVSVTGNTDISGLRDSRGADDSADATVKIQLVGALETGTSSRSDGILNTATGPSDLRPRLCR